MGGGPPLPLPAFAVPATPAPSVVLDGRVYAVVEVPHFAIRYPGDDPADVAALPAIAQALETGYAQLAALLGEAPAYTIPVLLEHDLEATRPQPGIVLYRRDIPYADQAPHALAHIFTGYTGYPFLEEGLAVYASMLVGGVQPWPLNGVPAGHQVAAGLTAGRYTALPTAFRYMGLGRAEYGSALDQAGAQTMYLEAGAFAQFMIGRYGPAAYRALLERIDPAVRGAGARPGRHPDRPGRRVSRLARQPGGKRAAARAARGPGARRHPGGRRP